MLTGDFVRKTRLSLSQLYPQQEASALCGMICTEILGLSRYAHIVSPKLEIDPAALAKASSAVERLLSFEPVQYVLGYADFCSRRFRVGPGVLIPRPETERLCELALCEAQALRPVRILDLCTGSGCIAWTLCLDSPGSEVVGVDVSREALRYACSQPFDGPSRPQFVLADIFDGRAMEGVLGEGHSFDILVSNPPYIYESEKGEMRRNVLDWEPENALFVPSADTQAFNRRLGEIASRALRPDGVAIIEINENSGLESLETFARNFTSCSLVKDCFDKDRFVLCRRPIS